jgi:soluble lytic murein transglycosylase
LSLSLGLAVLLALAPASPAWRLAADPSDTAESALRDAAVRDGAKSQDALAAVARQYPASAVSGLAHLTAGLRLLDAHRYADALSELAHPDIQRTLLRDHALYATGRAQEALAQNEPAARSYLAAAAEPASGVLCPALTRAADLLLRARQPEAAASALEQVVGACPRDRPDALLALGDAQLARGDRPAAAAAFERLEREHPASTQAGEARGRLRTLSDVLPQRTPEEHARALLQRGTALVSAARAREALDLLRSVRLDALPAAEADAARVSLARALLLRGQAREARLLLEKIPAESALAAEAAFLLAREQVRRSGKPDAFELVAAHQRGTPWAEEALFSLANFYQKDALDAPALPWWRRLLIEFPDGRYVERAAWRCGWADYRVGRYAAAADTLESAARLRPPSSSTPGFLYWAGRARLAINDERGRALLEETVQRFKHTYHGLRASEALGHLGGPRAPRLAVLSDGTPSEPPLPEPRATRLRQLLLVERLDEAQSELRLLPDSSRTLATIAWIDWCRGRYRPAIVTMKRAYPEWVSEAGDALPQEVWSILFPLRYEPELLAAAGQEALDPALVAALILQESTFDAAALSRAGARGLMQVMPATGRRIARAKGQHFRRAALHDPGTSLDFGTHYLRQMSDRFSGAVEKVLAAYNAGPHRVDAWVAQRGDTSAEDFIESIPFSETRGYVMIVLANREQYRRLYGLARSAPGPASEGARP